MDQPEYQIADYPSIVIPQARERADHQRLFQIYLGNILYRLGRLVTVLEQYEIAVHQGDAEMMRVQETQLKNEIAAIRAP